MKTLCGSATAAVGNRGYSQHRRLAPEVPASRGFTLIELLVVVSIIALLISILLPSLRTAREQAKLVRCATNQRGMGQAGFTFAEDHRGRFQLVSNSVGVNKADSDRKRFEYTPTDRELLSWPVAIAQAAGFDWEHNWQWGARADDPDEALARQQLMSDEFELATCPADVVLAATPFYPRGDGPGMLSGPGDPSTSQDDNVSGGTAYWGRLSFAINEDLAGAEVQGNIGAVGRYWRDPAGNQRWAVGELHPQAGERLRGNLDRVYDPGTVLLMVDAGPNDLAEMRAGQHSASSNTGFANLITSAKCIKGPLLADFQWQWVNRIPQKRHPGGRVSVIFADFHGELVQPGGFRHNNIAQRQMPTTYSTRIRVSPYPPFAQ